MRIAVLSAILEEINLLKTDLQNSHCETIGEREYYSGSLYGIDSVLVFSRWGKVAAASATATLITKYNVDCLIFTGIAGAIAEHLNIGDIVIGNALYQHDMDARPLFLQHEIPLTGKTFFETDKNLLAKTYTATQEFISNDLNNYISTEILQTFAIDAPKIYIGKIASGDMFINDLFKTEQLRSTMPDVLAVEMEGAAVAQVCAEHNIPFIVVRTISDKADHNAHIDFQKFIMEVSEQYSKGIIKKLYQHLS
jgi:adenosylhomocysteine nucleosidase